MKNFNIAKTKLPRCILPSSRVKKMHSRNWISTRSRKPNTQWWISSIMLKTPRSRSLTPAPNQQRSSTQITTIPKRPGGPIRWAISASRAIINLCWTRLDSIKSHQLSTSDCWTSQQRRESTRLGTGRRRLIQQRPLKSTEFQATTRPS